jgi:hypothetical protein
MTDRERDKARLLRWYDHTIRECEQSLTDIASFNENRPECQPLDCEAERVMLDLLRKKRAAFETDDVLLQRELEKKWQSIFGAQHGQA